MKTNAQVKEALRSCIKDRWALMAQGANEFSVEPCALCELFDGFNNIVRLTNGKVKYTPSKLCKGCPVYLRNNGKGCATGSLYDQYLNDASRENAAAMLQFLKDTQTYFFGSAK